jgi:hypothetical protein
LDKKMVKDESLVTKRLRLQIEQLMSADWVVEGIEEAGRANVWGGDWLAGLVLDAEERLHFPKQLIRYCSEDDDVEVRNWEILMEREAGRRAVKH